MNRRDKLGGNGVPAVREDADAVGFSDLAEERITRARAIKLAGAMGATGAFALFLPDEADAANRKKRRRRKRRRRARARRRRQAAVTSPQPTVPVGQAPVGGTAPVTPVPITNEGDTAVTITPTVVGDGFTLADPGDITIAPGDTVQIPVIFAPQVGDVGDVKTGELRILDASDGLLLETVTLTGTIL